jgi:hypothetical protein
MKSGVPDVPRRRGHEYAPWLLESARGLAQSKTWRLSATVHGEPRHIFTPIGTMNLLVHGEEIASGTLRHGD